MHKTTNEIKQFFAEVKDLQVKDGVEAIVCAPFPYLQLLVDEAKGSSIQISAQNMHFEESGAFTGEVSPLMLQDIGVTYVIIGHSERRQYFNETNETVNKKVRTAHKHQLTPIVCVGESLDQREANETFTHIGTQVKEALNELSEEQIANTIIAYEPIWAIGTGKTASSADANEVCGHIRNVISKLTNDDIAEKVIIQYGGSVNSNNIEALLNEEHIDGALVGGASLDAASFKSLVEVGNQKS